MTTSKFAPSSHGWPPTKVAPRESFDGIDTYPAAIVKAPAAKIRKFVEIAEQEDELGTCLVANFEVMGTLVIFYQSALDAKDRWTIFVDMNGCVTKGQSPSLLGASVIQNLSSFTIKPEWVNAEADKIFRARRRAQSSGKTGVTGPSHKLVRKTTPSVTRTPPMRRNSTEGRLIAQIRGSNKQGANELAGARLASKKASSAPKNISERPVRVAKKGNSLGKTASKRTPTRKK